MSEDQFAEELQAAQGWVEAIREPGRSPQRIATDARHAVRFLNAMLSRTNQFVYIGAMSDGEHHADIKRTFWEIRRDLLEILQIAQSSEPFRHADVMLRARDVHRSIAAAITALAQVEIYPFTQGGWNDS